MVGSPVSQRRMQTKEHTPTNISSSEPRKARRPLQKRASTPAARACDWEEGASLFKPACSPRRGQKEAFNPYKSPSIVYGQLDMMPAGPHATHMPFVGLGLASLNKTVLSDLAALSNLNPSLPPISRVARPCTKPPPPKSSSEQHDMRSDKSHTVCWAHDMAHRQVKAPTHLRALLRSQIACNLVPH